MGRDTKSELISAERPWPSSVAGAVVLIDTSVVVRSARGAEPPGELFCGS